MQEGSWICIDASVLINLCHVSRLSWLGQLPYRFILLDAVHAEIQLTAQIKAIEEALEEGWLEREALDALVSGQLFAQLRLSMGLGEAECLAFAVQLGCAVLCDERGRFRAAAKETIGDQKILGTIDLYRAAIGRAWLSIGDADNDKAILAASRFILPFGSFAELDIQVEAPEGPPAS